MAAGAGSATVAGATEGEFAITSNVWTARQGFMADTFTMQGCGAAPWVVDEPQDVAGTGCIGVAHPIAECPREYDVVALLGDDLYFGERITDLCSKAGRPAALGAYLPFHGDRAWEIMRDYNRMVIFGAKG